MKEKAIGGSDACHTCAAHVLVITEDLEPRIAQLKAALRKYGRHTRNPCTATSDSKCVCGFAEALGTTSETAAKPTVCSFDKHIWNDSPDVDEQCCVSCFQPRPIACRYPGCTAKYDYHHVHAVGQPNNSANGVKDE